MKAARLTSLAVLLLSACSSGPTTRDVDRNQIHSVLFAGPSYQFGDFTTDLQADQHGNIWVARDSGITEMQWSQEGTYPPVLYPGIDLTALIIKPDGTIFGVNQGENSMIKFSPQSHALPRIFSGKQYGFNAPSGITMDPEGNIWVTNTGRRDTDVSSVTEIPHNRENAPVIFAGAVYHFNAPGDISADPDGNLWVVDQIGNRSHANVTEMKKIGEGQYQPVIFSGAAYGFYYPAGITTDEAGNVWISSYDNNTNCIMYPGLIRIRFHI